MSQEAYVITQHEHEDGIGFSPFFEIEVYTNEKKASDRLQELKDSLPKYAGFFYSLESCKLISK